MKLFAVFEDNINSLTVKSAEKTNYFLILTFLFVFWRLYCWYLETDFFKHDLIQHLFAVFLVIITFRYFSHNGFKLESALPLIIFQSFPYVYIYHDAMTLFLVSFVLIFLFNFKDYKVLSSIKQDFFLKLLLLNFLAGFIFALYSLGCYGITKIRLAKLAIDSSREIAFIMMVFVVSRTDFTRFGEILKKSKFSIIFLYSFCIISLAYILIFNDYYVRFTGLGGWNFRRLNGTANGSNIIALLICFSSVITTNILVGKRKLIYVLVKTIEIMILVLSASRSGTVVFLCVTFGQLFFVYYRKSWKLVFGTFLIAIPASYFASELSRTSFLAPRYAERSIYYNASTEEGDFIGIGDNRLFNPDKNAHNFHRKEVLKESLNVIKERFAIFGVGTSMESLFSKSKQDAHNVIVSMTAERGVIGLFTAVFIVFYIPWMSFRSYLSNKSLQGSIVFLSCTIPVFFYSLPHTMTKNELYWFLVGVSYYYFKQTKAVSEKV